MFCFFNKKVESKKQKLDFIVQNTFEMSAKIIMSTCSNILIIQTNFKQLIKQKRLLKKKIRRKFKRFDMISIEKVHSLFK